MLRQTLTGGIDRVKVPFENIDTGVFILTEGENTYLLDCAATSEDVNRYILPALREIGRNPELLILSHSHGDHAGGAAALLAAFPEMRVAFLPRKHEYPSERVRLLKDGERLGCYEIISLSGHDDDCLAVLDHSTRMLLSADCLQLRGVGRYGTSFRSYTDYLASIERVRLLGVSRIVASHDYVPLGCEADGAQAVGEYLNECVRVAHEMRKFALAHDNRNAEEAAALYNAAHADMPPVGGYVLAGIMREAASSVR